MDFLHKKHERGDVATTVRVGNAPLKDDVIPVWLYRKLPWLCYFDWHIRFWVYFDSIPHAVAWIGSIGFYIGSYLFMIGAFAAISMRILNSKEDGNCGGDIYDKIVIHLFLVGTILWLPSCYSQMMDASNHGYEARFEEWVTTGCVGPKPRYGWVSFSPRSVEWWGGVFYTVGIIAFLIALVSEEINDCGHKFSEHAHNWIHFYMYMAGGILFFVAGIWYIMAWESLWVIPGIIPMSIPDIKSLRWWGLWFYFWGGVMFCMTGVFFYWDNAERDTLSNLEYQIEFGIGYGGGTVFYFIGSICLLARLSRSRCRRSYTMIHNRLEPSMQQEAELQLPVVPVRYSMDKAFVHPLPTFRMYTTRKALDIIAKAKKEQEATGERQFFSDSYIPTDKNATSQPQARQSVGRRSMVRTNYLPRHTSDMDVQPMSAEEMKGMQHTQGNGHSAPDRLPPV